ncbi:amino acid ABC transporter permease [Chelatococcus asaccharovorans]|uniref:amino acid ABC transporter permease n=1 Tax=Chelatococcus asaccharovorans TaxID=28210 RepID=UPI00224C754B|nr:ABC transporter permease subunit [Chelatococcus asaccharovorans]CAH1653047.1 ABC transporter permease subunit [Chelatococcus asaccharovorans]CAH1686161.1 ABC transporter permease subunit [Chelatococcus asaccharovorans]
MSIDQTGARNRVAGNDLHAKRQRSNRFRYQAVQFTIIAAAVAVLTLLIGAVTEGLARHGIRFSFSFLWDKAGFDISEGKTLVFDQGIWQGIWPRFIEFTGDRSIAQAFVTGLMNTIKVALLAIVLSTILGTLLGLARLSTNWVIRNLSFWCVEFVRNTPLLIQIVFWYFAVVLKFPPLSAAAKLYGGIIISQQGFYFPFPTWEGGDSWIALVLLTAAFVAAMGAFVDRSRRTRRICAIVAVALIGLLLANGTIAFDYPVASRFRASGGASISPEMAALLLAIVVNSAAYIAEIVRGSIDALPKGQWEAAASLGMSRRQTLKDIILPQVFRIVLPSFGNQYISLTKNTALGIAIGYPDLFNVYGTVGNQTGHSLEGIVIVMASFLILSWIISALVGWADNHLNRLGAMR